jgi:hypothetical protein
MVVSLTATTLASCGTSGFCATHHCIPNFDNGTGSIVQCADGMWSHSGGRPGACSGHGGEGGRGGGSRVSGATVAVQPGNGPTTTLAVPAEPAAAGPPRGRAFELLAHQTGRVLVGRCRRDPASPEERCRLGAQLRVGLNPPRSKRTASSRPSSRSAIATEPRRASRRQPITVQSAMVHARHCASFESQTRREQAPNQGHGTNCTDLTISFHAWSSRSIVQYSSQGNAGL